MYEATPVQSFWYRQFHIWWTISRLLCWLMRPSAALGTRLPVALPHRAARAPGGPHVVARQALARGAPGPVEQAQVRVGADRHRARRSARIAQRRRIERERLLGRERFAGAERRAARDAAVHRGRHAAPRIGRAVGRVAAGGEAHTGVEPAA